MELLDTRYPIGNTGLTCPPIIFGTSCLGNLYEALPWQVKKSIMEEWFRYVKTPVVIDSAGKYGAGLALEMIGKGLNELGISRDQIVISNKLGWTRVPLTGKEPTFEPGVWKDIQYDAIQSISYEGIISCYEQGCELVGSDYSIDLVSVHDPDEYLAKADTPDARQKRFEDIVAAYKALKDMKREGRIKTIGIGAKDWTVIRELQEHIEFDWVMLALSMTIYYHPPEVLEFISLLNRNNIAIINSAVFHAGFLTGGKYFDYRIVDPVNPGDKHLFNWRDTFFNLCKEYNVLPAEACVQFGLSPAGVISISLNTSKPVRVGQNVDLVRTQIPSEFWERMKSENLIDGDYPYL